MFRLVVLFLIFLPLLTSSTPILKRTTRIDEYAPRERGKSGVETVVVDATGASQPAVGTTFNIHDLHLGYPSDALVTVNRQSDVDDAPIRTKNTTKEGDDVPSDSDKKEEIKDDIAKEEEQHKTDESKDDANDDAKSDESETKTEETSQTSDEESASTTEEPAENSAESSEDQVTSSPSDESSSGREMTHELPPIDYAIDIEADRLAQLEEEAESARLEEERQARAERARVLYEMELQAQEKLDAEMARLKEQQEKERVEREKVHAEQTEQRKREYQIQKQQQQVQQRIYEEQRRKEQEQQQQQQQSPEYAITVPGTIHEVVTANPTETVFNAFQTSTLFQELTVWNAWNLIQVGRPFAIFILCRCERDDDWNVPRMESLIREQGLADHFTYLYALPEIQHRFHMFQTYAIDSPALVIDNMPIGQHIEKYVFPKRMARPTQAVPEDMVTFFEDFFKDPTPLPLLIRSRPAPPPRAMNERGMVWELVGDTMTDIVFNSPYTVLLLLYSPSCPACHTIMPVFDRVAALLSFSEPNVIIAKLDRTVNDVPFILRFHKYPTILLFRANHKHMTHISQEHLSARERVQQRGLYGSHGWAAPLDFDVDYRAKQAPQQEQQQHQQHSCGRPYDEHELIAFVKQHVSRPAIEASSSFESTSSSSSPSA